MELVTGKAGTPHVSSADDGRRIAGEVGTGSYVLQTGGRLAPSLVDANTVRFATGDMIVQGRHIGLTAPEDVKVASGTQGKKRTDYICVHYKRDVSGANPTLVETCEWKVLQGTPGTDATAPSVPSGSILNGDSNVTEPICSVTFDGLTTGEPKLLIPVLTPLAALGDSVSQVPRIRKFSTSIVRAGSNWDSNGRLLAITKDEYKELVGRDFNGFDVVQAFNGDMAVNSFDVTNLSYWGSGNFWVDVSGGRSEYTAQINIKIIAIDFE